MAKFGPVKEPLKWAQATLNVEYVAGAIMSEPLPLSYSASFSSLQYRLGAKASDPEYKKLAFPNTMETLKIVSSAVRAEFRLEFDVAGVAPNNTYLLLQHKTHPSVSATVHFDPARRHTVLDFSNTEFIKNMNGEYKVSLISEGAGLAAKSLVWDLGSILVDLPSGTTDYVEPVTRGPLKFKEIRHIFAPELVYAPGVVAYAVAGFIVVLLLVFFFSICGLKTGMSNVPASFSGKLYAAVFVILMIALFALLVYFWFFMRLLDLLPILCVFGTLPIS